MCLPSLGENCGECYRCAPPPASSPSVPVPDTQKE